MGSLISQYGVYVIIATNAPQTHLSDWKNTTEMDRGVKMVPQNEMPHDNQMEWLQRLWRTDMLQTNMFLTILGAKLEKLSPRWKESHGVST